MYHYQTVLPGGGRLGIREATSADQDFLYEMLFQCIYTPPGARRPGREVLELPEIRHYVEGWGSRSGDFALIAEVDGIIEAADHRPLPTLQAPPPAEPGKDSRAGALWLRYFTADEPGYGFISEDVPEIGIAVSRGIRGRGIGTALLEGVLMDAGSGDRPYRALSLSVDARNPARNLYRRHGFVETGRSGNSMVMSLAIPIR